MKKKKIDFKGGDIFIVPLMNSKYSIGQVLDQRMINTVRIALFNEVIGTSYLESVERVCNVNDLISLIEVTKEQIVYSVWKIIGNKQISIPISKYPNEQFRNNKWVGSIVSDAALAEDFLNAFYALRPWDSWHDPNYLDRYLIDIKKKPENLIYSKG